METYQYLIIGGGIGGTTAAETVRSKEPNATIAIVTDEPHRLYSKVMLSKPSFFLGQTPFDSVWLRKEESYKEKNIVRLFGRKAVKLDPAAKTVTLDDGSTVGYGKLLLSFGTYARPWPVPGADLQGIHYVRTVEDGKAIIEAVKTAKKGVVIGSGFIGFEMCEMLKLAGLEVTSLIREKYFWEPFFDETSGKMIETVLEKGGVRLIRNTLAHHVVGSDRVEGIALPDGTILPCDLVIAAIGAYPPTDWLKGSGLEMNRGIVANEFLETNLPDVWTAGDCAEFNDLVLGERTCVGTWVNAQMQGRQAALNMTGSRQAYRMVSFYTAKGFEMNVGSVGNPWPVPGRDYVSRGVPEEGWNERFVFKGPKLMGATIVGRTQDVGVITQLINKGVDLSARKAELADPKADLKTLLT